MNAPQLNTDIKVCIFPRNPSSIPRIHYQFRHGGWKIDSNGFTSKNHGRLEDCIAAWNTLCCGALGNAIVGFGLIVKKASCQMIELDKLKNWNGAKQSFKFYLERVTAFGNKVKDEIERIKEVECVGPFSLDGIHPIPRMYPTTHPACRTVMVHIHNELSRGGVSVEKPAPPAGAVGSPEHAAGLRKRIIDELQAVHPGAEIYNLQVNGVSLVDWQAEQSRREEAAAAERLRLDGVMRDAMEQGRVAAEKAKDAQRVKNAELLRGSVEKILSDFSEAVRTILSE